MEILIMSGCIPVFGTALEDSDRHGIVTVGLFTGSASTICVSGSNMLVNTGIRSSTTIRQQTIDESTIEELLFAVRKKIKEVK